ncbi:MAG: methylmalonyl-CoA carboxyltransferase [Deltaproteobacteria bacterium]|nr:methylmalonyl-CoA carboxyltransferase [Deltaproteobacteria bacterium]MBW2384654.1 methylmalonyl-CoA carboxyltransferase [Deltaproteobacteria bacterium]
MSWKPELDEIARRKALAARMGGEERVARHVAAGRLPVRERIERLLDEGSFRETGSLAGKVIYTEDGEIESYTPSNFVTGRGTIDGRRIVIGCDDFTVRGGAADGAVGNKMGWSEKTARELRLPIVRLVDGTGGGGSVRTNAQIKRSYVPANPDWDVTVALLSEVPVVAAALGPVAGLGAARVAASHFSVMVRESSQLFVAGPPIVARAFGREVGKEELGGSHIHARESGAVDNDVASEEEAFAEIRSFLSYLPTSVWERPPRRQPTDDPDRREEALLSFIPRNRRKVYDMRELLGLVLDRDSFFEMGRYFGRPLVTGLARLDGIPIGVMANDPKHAAGSIDADAGEKMQRFVDLCDTFHLPVVNFVDNPGFLVGREAEKRGTIRKGVRALTAVFQASVPWCSIIVRKAYGVAGAGHSNHTRSSPRYAWPSGEWGSLPIEGGVEAAYKRVIAASEDPDATRRELEAKLESLRNPILTAESFGVEELIDPRETRPLLVEWARRACEIVESSPRGPKARGMRP